MMYDAETWLSKFCKEKGIDTEKISDEKWEDLEIEFEREIEGASDSVYEQLKDSFSFILQNAGLIK